MTDANLVHQQNIARHSIAVIALRAKSNRLGDSRPLMNHVLAVLPQSQPGTLTFIPRVMSSSAQLIQKLWKLQHPAG